MPIQTWHIRYVLASGEVRLSFLFTEEETADRTRRQILQDPVVITAELITQEPTHQPQPA